MKHWNLVLAATAACAAITLSTSSFAQKAGAAKPLPAKPLDVAVLIYPDVDVLDVSGPVDVFTTANEIAPGSYNVYTVAGDSELVAAKKGVLTIKPRYTIQNSPKPDILVVPGASLNRLHQLYTQHSLMDWIKQTAKSSRLTMSVCTGAFLLGKADVLNGRKSTTHWFALDSLQQEFPKTTAMQGVRFVEDGNIVSTAGVTSGIDGALHVVEKMQSKKVADVVARVLQYRRGTPAYPDQPRAMVASSRSALKSSPPANGQKLFSKSDPVCTMAVDSHTKITAQYQGHLYGFCSTRCRGLFAAHPEKYAK